MKCKVALIGVGDSRTEGHSNTNIQEGSILDAEFVDSVRYFYYLSRTQWRLTLDRYNVKLNVLPHFYL